MPASQPVGMLYLAMADLRAQLTHTPVSTLDVSWVEGLVNGDMAAPNIATPDDLERLRDSLAELVVYAEWVAWEYGVELVTGAAP